MEIGKTDAELAEADGYASRLYSACKRLAWASLILFAPSVIALGFAFSGQEGPRLSPFAPVLIVCICLGVFLWGILWPRTYPSRRKARQWLPCLLGVLLLFVPTAALSIASVFVRQYVNVSFDYRTEVFEPAGYPAASFLALEYIPPSATGIRLRGKTGLGWIQGGYAAFSCQVSEEGFLAFAKEHLYELRAEKGGAPFGEDSCYERLFPGDRLPGNYWIHRLVYPNGGGVTLVFDRDDPRLLGTFSTN